MPLRVIIYEEIYIFPILAFQEVFTKMLSFTQLGILPFSASRWGLPYAGALKGNLIVKIAQVSHIPLALLDIIAK